MPTYNLASPPRTGNPDLDRWLTSLYQRINGTTASGGAGYANGQGGSVTQATSKSTGVTLSKPCGQITMNAAALASGAKVAFTVTNTTVVATDVVAVCVASPSGATADAYRASVTKVAAGSFNVLVENVSGGSLSDAPIISFAIFKSVIA